MKIYGAIMRREEANCLLASWSQVEIRVDSAARLHLSINYLGFDRSSCDAYFPQPLESVYLNDLIFYVQGSLPRCFRLVAWRR